jgi:hypothetical protein
MCAIRTARNKCKKKDHLSSYETNGGVQTAAERKFRFKFLIVALRPEIMSLVSCSQLLGGCGCLCDVKIVGIREQ